MGKAERALVDTQAGAEANVLAYATATRGADGAWNLRIAERPHCGAAHSHGGGDGDRPAIGPRVAHCGHGLRVYHLVTG